MTHEIVHEIIEELRRENQFQPTPDIDMVWVISLPGTVLTPTQDGIYKGELADLEIVNAGIDLVQRITAVRLHKNPEEITKGDIQISGPVLYYNGESSSTGNSRYPQNEDLATLVASPYFPIPSENVIIRSLKENNTRGQILQIVGFLRENPLYKKIAVVGSAPHQRRTARYLTQYSSYFPDDITLLDVSIPVRTNQVGKTLREVRKIVYYEKQGHLARTPYF